ncbi:hypothetical protein IGK74_000814 [Enterococcus sp. AZ150]|uniref:Uncharacterized protein n=1 Tax=Enterococcus sulfureus ATCC 49903 TaxID=1140003 RepID=S0P1C7_9ENTE|nr:aspartate/glutamate racemase family protein [Enterococcus sulfureus]EOT47624.1 hypothetical protein OMY_00998 [Enterococcus sulfureus ATCC 49903]EOT83955.1 hypothetical protein I573_01680 [Enterococcus sulfureus ATCC 49903]
MKLAILGGTKIDTMMGCHLFETQLSCQTSAFPVSHSPQEQTRFQTSSLEVKQNTILNLLFQAKEEGCQAVVVYCNSLSASLSFARLEKEVQLPIITPFAAYQKLKNRKIGILAANAQGAAGIEKEIIQHNPNATVYSMTNLDWVEAVEAKKSPEWILHYTGLLASIDFFEQVDVECILIGCTHFPYFLSVYQANTTLLCINPDDYLLEKIRTLSFKGEKGERR